MRTLNDGNPTLRLERKGNLIASCNEKFRVRGGLASGLWSPPIVWRVYSSPTYSSDFPCIDSLEIICSLRGTRWLAQPPTSHLHGTMILVGRDPVSPSGSSIESHWPGLSHVILCEPITIAQGLEDPKEPGLD